MASPSVAERADQIFKAMTRHPDFPKAGINFVDIFPVMRDAALFGDLISILTDHVQQNYKDVEVIVGLDARGFIFGPLIAQKLGIGFVPIRKAGKLPGQTVQASYTLEYGSDQFEAQKDSVRPGQKVIIIDDLLATGGTMGAACKLMKELQADILECIVVIELVSDFCNGRQKVPAKLYSLIQTSE